MGRAATALMLVLIYMPVMAWEVSNSGTSVNTDYHEAFSAITTDGLTLFISSDRPGGYGSSEQGVFWMAASYDIYVTHRESLDSAWGPVVNLGSKLSRTEDHDSPDTVKVVAGTDGQALCFSRAPIPSRSQTGNVPMYQQTGVMAFTKGFLDQFAALAPTPLEIAESVDMLRVLEHGMALHVVFTEIETLGIDTPEDKIRGEELLAADSFTGSYLDVSQVR